MTRYLKPEPDGLPQGTWRVVAGDIRHEIAWGAKEVRTRILPNSSGFIHYQNDDGQDFLYINETWWSIQEDER